MKSVNAFILAGIIFASSLAISQENSVQDPINQICRNTLRQTILELQKTFFKEAIQTFGVALSTVNEADFANIPLIIELRDNEANIQDNIQEELRIQKGLIANKSNNWNQLFEASLAKEENLKKDLVATQADLDKVSSLAKHFESFSTTKFQFDIKNVRLWHNPLKAADSNGWERGPRIVLSFNDNSELARTLKLKGGNLFYSPSDGARYQFTLKTDDGDFGIFSAPYNHHAFAPIFCNGNYKEDAATLHEALDFFKIMDSQL